MILNDLYRYYETKKLDENAGLPPRYWSNENIAWEFRINGEGRLISVVSLQEDEKKTTRKMIVPEHTTATSGIKAFFLCHKAAYFLGRDAKRGSECLAASKELHRKVLGNLQDDAAQALLSFLDQHEGVDELSSEMLESLDEGANIVFRFQSDNTYLHERPLIREAWEKHCFEQERDTLAFCTVVGETRPRYNLFPMVRGVAGAQSSGASLISFNEESFLSYGQDNKEMTGASISSEAVFAVGEALRYLVRDKKHHLYLGDSILLYWAEEGTEKEDDFLSLVLDMDNERIKAREDDERTEEIEKALRNIRAGLSMEEINEGTRYHILCLAPSAARLSVRFYHVDTIGHLKNRFKDYLQDIEMVDRAGLKTMKSQSIRTLLRQTAPPGTSGEVPGPLIAATCSSILSGDAFPRALFMKTLLRTRSDKGYIDKNDQMGIRAAIFKAALLRERNVQYAWETEGRITVSLNTENKEIGYLLGRLFAVLEKAQNEAIPGANSTIRDRFIGSAAATPARVFPQLLKTAQHHISKAEYGQRFERVIGEIMSGIDAFPKTLDYDEQGLFYIGYYQQKAAFFVPRAVNEDVTEEGNEE